MLETQNLARHQPSFRYHHRKILDENLHVNSNIVFGAILGNNEYFFPFQNNAVVEVVKTLEIHLLPLEGRKHKSMF